VATTDGCNKFRKRYLNDVAIFGDKRCDFLERMSVSVLARDTRMIDSVREGNALRLPPVLMQPVAAADVAAARTDLAVNQPLTPDLWSCQEVCCMKPVLSRWPALLDSGLAAGVAVAYVDNCAFAGEISPIVIVALLLAATALFGALWGRRGWIAAAVTWACLPLAHVVKHVLGLPDTLHPNTYFSILCLAAFTLVVATVGAVCGVVVRNLATGPLRRDDGSA
jgi:hypothetical protein